jgi:hypothetical protein
VPFPVSFSLPFRIPTKSRSWGGIRTNVAIFHQRLTSRYVKTRQVDLLCAGKKFSGLILFLEIKREVGPVLLARHEVGDLLGQIISGLHVDQSPKLALFGVENIVAEERVGSTNGS